MGNRKTNISQRNRYSKKISFALILLGLSLIYTFTAAKAWSATITTINGDKTTVENIKVSTNKQNNILNSIFIGPVAEHIYYGEEMNGPSDSESGMLYGVELGYTTKFINPGMVPTFVGIASKLLFGRLTYDGHYFSGEPVTYKHNDSIYDIEIKFGFLNNLYNVSSKKIGHNYWSIYTIIGDRYWHRSVVEENYHTGYIGIGSSFAYAFSPQFTSVLDISARLAPRSGANYMETTIYPVGDYKFYMGTCWNAKISYNITRHWKKWSLSLTPYFSYWHFGKSSELEIINSNGTTETYWEPSSHTEEVGINCMMSYSFGGY